MNESKGGKPDDHKAAPADAVWLRGEELEAGPRPDRRAPEAFDPAKAEGYDLVDASEVETGTPESPAPRRSRPAAIPSWEDEREPKAKAGEDESSGSADRVDEVWSRGAEWGSNLLAIGIAVAATLVLAYMSFNAGQVGLAMLILLIGGLALLALAYPLLITLERPLRMTPEQAVRDYYAALAHHMPHYRRMWLLLSNAGRWSDQFGSFPGFRDYWKKRLAELKAAGRVGGSTPLVFELKDFDSASSKGKRQMVVRYRVEVHARGQRSEPPLAVIPQETPVVRGSDNMWYLGRGTL